MVVFAAGSAPNSVLLEVSGQTLDIAPPCISDPVLMLDDTVRDALLCVIKDLRTAHPILFVGESDDLLRVWGQHAEVFRAWLVGRMKLGMVDARPPLVLQAAEMVFTTENSDSGCKLRPTTNSEFLRLTSSVVMPYHAGAVCVHLLRRGVTRALDPCAGSGWATAIFSLFLPVVATDSGDNKWYDWAMMKNRFINVSDGIDAATSSAYDCVDESCALLLLFPDNPRKPAIARHILQHFRAKGGRYVVSVTSDQDPGVSICSNAWEALSRCTAIISVSVRAWGVFDHCLNVWDVAEMDVERLMCGAAQ